MEQLSGEVEGVLRRDRIICEVNVLTRYGLDIVDELIWGERVVDDVRCAERLEEGRVVEGGGGYDGREPCQFRDLDG